MTASLADRLREVRDLILSWRTSDALRLLEDMIDDAVRDELDEIRAMLHETRAVGEGRPGGQPSGGSRG